MISKSIEDLEGKIRELAAGWHNQIYTVSKTRNGIFLLRAYSWFVVREEEKNWMGCYWWRQLLQRNFNVAVVDMLHWKVYGK